MNAQGDDLLNQVLTAHGGLERWNSFSQVRATLVTGGSLWAMKGLTQATLAGDLSRGHRHALRGAGFLLR